MGKLEYWILATIAFGLISAGFYTWLSPRRKGAWLWVFIRSAVAYILVGMAVVWLLFKIANL
jgi:hypothetical protein